jgi:RND superfamily putative drug exporter
MLSEGFGPGFTGPLQVVGVVQPDQHDVITQVASDIAKQPGVASVSTPTYIPSKTGDGSVLLMNVFPTTAPQDQATTNLVNHLRGDTIPAAVGHSGLNLLVGGDTAIFIDFANVLSSKLPLFIGLVVLLSFILLMVVFRSLLIPLTAACMNLLSIGAALGILVAVFQWGDGGSLIGLSGTSPVEAFLPVMLFAILFGLSMDYQVFLVSRMHEEYIKSGGDNRVAVRNGLAATGKTITAAALIMILVFASFILGGQRVIKEFGIGLAGGVLVDAVIIRMAVVPSIMMMFGKANWYLPAWLDRILPHLSVDADDLQVGVSPGTGGSDPEPELAGSARP